MLNELYVDKLSVFEWYDGIVFGLISSCDEMFFAILLAFDADDGMRRYAIVPAADRDFSNVSSDDVDDLVTEAKNCAAGGLMYLTSDEPHAGKSLQLKVASQEDQLAFTMLEFPFIEGAVTSNAKARWFAQ